MDHAKVEVVLNWERPKTTTNVFGFGWLLKEVHCGIL